MGCIQGTILFEKKPPSVDELVAALCQHTGESVHFIENDTLACAATDDHFTAIPPDAEHPYWSLLTLNLLGGYLWYATLAVLQVLGAEPCVLPLWAYKSWPEAQHEYEQRDVPWVTLGEARRLGVE